MRTIKFRAWDKEQGKMFRDIDGALTYKMLAINAFGQPFFYQMGTAPFKHFEGEHLVIQQFTGLLDKNGVEIFEGDIVRYNGLKSWEVRWGYDSWTMIAKDGMEIGEENATDDPHFTNWERDCEVLGNIYENPELLNQ